MGDRGWKPRKEAQGRARFPTWATDHGKTRRLPPCCDALGGATALGLGLGLEFFSGLRRVREGLNDISKVRKRGSGPTPIPSMADMIMITGTCTIG